MIDASAAAAWLRPDETGIDLAAVVVDHSQVLAPRLLWAEMRNLLIVQERRGRLSLGQAEKALVALDRLNIAFDIDPGSAMCMALARHHGLPVYDAMYLELAVRASATLATLDRRLAESAAARGVRLV
ncbi:MAG: type II toxin-antitoxin system VapC family toxin [Gemmobacter sp.]